MNKESIHTVRGSRLVLDRIHPKYWYLIRTKGHQEKTANISLQHLGVETFFPNMRKVKIVPRLKQTVICPLFPGYLFCWFNWSTDYRKVKYAHGVWDVVTFGSKPAIVDEATIELIRSRMTNGFVSPSSTNFHQGQEVRIEGGPFHGLEAVFDMDLSGTQRVALLLKTVVYHARIIIDRNQVVKLMEGERERSHSS